MCLREAAKNKKVLFLVDMSTKREVGLMACPLRKKEVFFKLFFVAVEKLNIFCLIIIIILSLLSSTIQISSFFFIRLISSSIINFDRNSEFSRNRLRVLLKQKITYISSVANPDNFAPDPHPGFKTPQFKL